MTFPILALVFGGVAGWLMWTRLPAGDGESEDRLERAFASTLCAVFTTGCVSLLMAEFALFRPLPLAACLALLCAGLWWLPRRSGPAAPASWPHVATMLVVGALSVASVAPASEEVLGGRDPGTYANTAILLAQNGRLKVDAETLASLDREMRPIFRGSVIFPGFYIENGARAEIVPQFLHLHPTYMAVGYWLGGPRGALLVPPFIGVLAELAVFFFVRRMSGAGAAAIAAAVLALNLAQIWGVRNPYSEGPTQLGFFAALWCLAAAQRTSGLRWGVLAGVALGTCFLARADGLLLLAAVLPAVVVIIATSQPRQIWFGTAFMPLTVLFAVWSVIHAWFFSRPYITDLAPLVRPLVLLTIVTVIVCGVAVLARDRVRPLIEWVHAHGSGLWIATAIALCAAFAITMWVRPHLEPFAISARRGTRTYAEQTLARVGWYFSTTGMILGIAGVVLIFRHWLVQRRAQWLPFLAPFLAFSILYFWNHRIAPDHPWMMRRFLPVVVPGIAVAISVTISYLWMLNARRRLVARVCAVAAAGIVLAHEMTMAAPFWNFREKDGAVEQVAAVARHVPPGSVLLFSYPGIDHHVATPLATEWGRTVLPILREPDWDRWGERRRGRFEKQVMRWLGEGREVLYLTGNDVDSIFLARDLRWEEITRPGLDLPVMGSHLQGPPRAPLRYRAEYKLLRAVSAVAQPVSCSGSSLDVDSRLGGTTQGFYGVETIGRDRYYWASPEARIMFPNCDRTRPVRPTAARVYAACGRTPKNDDCRVDVTINDQPAGTLQLSREFADHEVAVPAGALTEPAGAIEIGFRGPAFRPADVGLADQRLLSFQLTSVTLR